MLKLNFMAFSRARLCSQFLEIVIGNNNCFSMKSMLSGLLDIFNLLGVVKSGREVLRKGG